MHEIFGRSKQMINQLETAGATTSDILKEIKRQTGQLPKVQAPVKVKPFAALRDFYKQLEKVGTAGYKRGLREATAQGKAASALIKPAIF